ncbi:MAG: hypothetical protein AB8U88_00645 [Rickettsia conorii subsp. raoultii]|uniref:Uncharacterized protein n=1 Tax=Rickettsia conorii subsp. raoultii TaxID=369822 RepID=A0A9N7BM20_RICCR|nr:hypothetical protein [Rickettsia conorii]AJQ51704.1 hypothetical protein UQ52_02420 [Rickettsia conorii subsp. raoultii]APZ29910.1 hypothetical protein RRIM16_02610 [Rickettsia conorii subsp. raoultii]URW77893.1 hypothetical protein NBT09_00490 [Rickettsia conorii subsp. raoultii]
MSNIPKIDDYYYRFLQSILLKTLEQNKAAETYLLQQDFNSALNEIRNVNEQLEEYSSILSLLKVIKTHFSDKKIYN